MSQSHVQQSGALVLELTGREVQAREGMVRLQGGGEISPLMGGGRTRHQPAGDMGGRHP